MRVSLKLAGWVTSLALALSPGLLSLGLGAAQAGPSIDQARDVVARYTPGSPNFIDLLKERFPADLETMVGDIGPADPGDASFGKRVMAELAKTLVRVQLRDGDKIYEAPDADLNTTLRGQRELISALLADNPAACKPGVENGMSTPKLGKLFMTRLHQVLVAIADGRDRPGPPRLPMSGDSVKLAQAASEQGVDARGWRILGPDSLPTAEPTEVCRAYVSVYDVALNATGDAAERIRAFMVHDLLVARLDFSYWPVPQQ